MYQKEVLKTTIKNQNIKIMESEYHGYSGKTAVHLLVESEYGDFYEPLLTLSVNIPDVELPPNLIHVKTWSENQSYIQDIVKTGLFKRTGKSTPTGFVTAEIWECLWKTPDIKIPKAIENLTNWHKTVYKDNSGE